MSAKKAKRRPKARISLLTRVMENVAANSMKVAWGAAWKAAQSDELRNVLLHNFLQEFVIAMRGEVEKKAAELGMRP